MPRTKTGTTHYHAQLGLELGGRTKKRRSDVRTYAYYRASTLLIMDIVSMLYEYNRLQIARHNLLVHLHE